MVVVVFVVVSMAGAGAWVWDLVVGVADQRIKTLCGTTLMHTYMKLCIRTLASYGIALNLDSTDAILPKHEVLAATMQARTHPFRCEIASRHTHTRKHPGFHSGTHMSTHAGRQVRTRARIQVRT